MTTWKELFKKKFKPVYAEMKTLRGKIHKKEWFLFVDYHPYSVEDLKKSEHLSRINSITRKIGDDVSYWNRRNKIDQEGTKQYYKHRDYTLEWLERIDKEIEMRDSTLWDDIFSIFNDFIEIIMSNLPILGSIFPELTPIWNGFNIWKIQRGQERRRLKPANSCRYYFSD